MQNTISGWDAVKGRQAFTWRTESLHLWQVFDGAFLPDGMQILLAGRGLISQVNLWDGVKTASYESLEKTRDSYYAVGVRSDGKFGAVTAMASDIFSVPNPMALTLGVPSETRSATLEHPQKIHLLDLEEKKILGSVDFNDSFVRSIQFSHNFKYLITTSYLRVRFWDITNPFEISLAKEVHVNDFVTKKVHRWEIFVHPQNPPTQLLLATAISPDMRLTAVATPYEIFVLSNESGLIVPPLIWPQPERQSKVNYLVWSASGQEIMGSNLQGQIFVWSISNTSNTYVGSYNNVSGIPVSLDFSHGPQPYVSFAIDPFRRYFIRPGRETASRGCSGFEVMRLPDMKRID